MKTTTLALISVLAMQASVTALGQIRYTFEVFNPGTESSPAYIPDGTGFELEMPNTVPLEIELQAAYNGTVQIQASSANTGPATFQVTLPSIVVTLDGDGMSAPKTINLGPYVGQAVDVAPNATASVAFSPAFVAGAAKAMLTGLATGDKGTYTLTWWVSAINVEHTGFKQATVTGYTHRLVGSVAVPEPGEYALVAGLGLVALALWRRRF